MLYAKMATKLKLALKSETVPKEKSSATKLPSIQFFFLSSKYRSPEMGANR